MARFNHVARFLRRWFRLRRVAAMTTERPEGDIDSTWTPAQMATELRRLAGCKVAPELWPTECVAIAAALDLADALAKAVEAMWANRAWESTSAPEKLNKGDFIIG